ncbi:hypothetical protein ACQEU6_02580 [Spirillospora sp. CA-108201]
MPTEDRSELVFNGAPEFLEWLYALDRRPWPLTSEKLLPIVHLRVEDAPGASRNLLEALRAHWTAHRLRGARQCVVVAPSETVTVNGVEQLLAAAAAQFFQGNRLVRGRGAPHFALASWLASLRGEAPEGLSEDTVLAQLTEHLSQYMLSSEAGASHGVRLETISDLPWWIKLLAHHLPRLALQIADRLFGPQRWFERRGGGQRQVTHPGEPAPLRGNLLTLAKRFAAPADPELTQRQVNALLVDALLQDLRRAHSRRGVFGRGRRRRTYPVLLLGGETQAAADLLIALQDVRNGRPRRGGFKRDPLLVVAAGPRPAFAISPRAREEAPGSPESAYERWHEDLMDAPRRDRDWLLRFVIPAPQPQTEAPDSRVRDWVKNIRPPLRVPWMSFVGVALLIAGVIAVPVTSHEFCRTWWSPSIRAWGLRDDMTLEDLGDDDRQCVGLAGEDPQRISGTLAGPIKMIRTTNAAVVHRDRYVTVVHLTMLSPGNEQGERATREELRGLAIAQRESLQSDVPIRVLLANAGANMEYADRAAQKIVAAASRDRRIVGAVGLGVSTRQTIDAVRRLGQAGLPSIGSATTADGLISASPYYYQVSPSNQRQAAFASRYGVANLRAKRARLYYSADPNDNYSGELATVMRHQLGAAGVEVTDYAGYRVSDDGRGEGVAQLGRRGCRAAKGPGEIVVYAGRAERFEHFLNGMKLACQNRYPRILATDDVSRFVLTGTDRNYPGLRLEYMALASSALWGHDCKVIQKQGSFYIRYEDVFGSACNENRDGRALLTFDALAVVRQAASNVLASDPTALEKQGIITGLPGIRGDGRVSGVSGDLDYSDPEAPRTPVDKAIMVLRATDGQPCLVKVEGRFSSQDKITSDC